MTRVLYLKIGDEQQQFALKMAARISNAIALRRTPCVGRPVGGQGIDVPQGPRTTSGHASTRSDISACMASSAQASTSLNSPGEVLERSVITFRRLACSTKAGLAGTAFSVGRPSRLASTSK